MSSGTAPKTAAGITGVSVRCAGGPSAIADEIVTANGLLTQKFSNGIVIVRGDGAYKIRSAFAKIRPSVMPEMPSTAALK